MLDYVLVCDKLTSSIKKVIIDEKRTFTLTKYATKKGIRIKKESDHNPIFVQFDIRALKCYSSHRQEFFDFRNKESLKTFKLLSEDCPELRDCWSVSQDPSVKSQKFFKSLNNLFHRSFKKIRIRSGLGPHIKSNDEEAKWLALKVRLLSEKSSTNCLQHIRHLKSK